MDCLSCFKNKGKYGFIARIWNPERGVETEFKMYICEDCRPHIIEMFPKHEITEEPYYLWVKKFLIPT